MPRNRSFFFIPRLASVVGFSKATTPPTETANNPNSMVIVPNPGQVGDRVAGIIGSLGASSAKPIVPVESGYDFAFMLEDSLIVQRTVQAGDPASYSFRVPVSAESRSGCLVALRGGATIDSAFGPADSLAFGAMTNTTAGALFIGFAKCHHNSGGFSESFAAGAPLSLGVQHAAKGSAFSLVAYATCIAIETGLPAGSVTGRSVSNSAPTLSNRRTIALIYG